MSGIWLCSLQKKITKTYGHAPEQGGGLNQGSAAQILNRCSSCWTRAAEPPSDDILHFWPNSLPKPVTLGLNQKTFVLCLWLPGVAFHRRHFRFSNMTSSLFHHQPRVRIGIWRAKEGFLLAFNNYASFGSSVCLLFREDSQIDFFTQSVFWTLGRWGLLQVDALKNQWKIDFWPNKFF